MSGYITISSPVFKGIYLVTSRPSLVLPKLRNKGYTLLACEVVIAYMMITSSKQLDMNQCVSSVSDAGQTQTKCKLDHCIKVGEWS